MQMNDCILLSSYSTQLFVCLHLVASFLSCALFYDVLFTKIDIAVNGRTSNKNSKNKKREYVNGKVTDGNKQGKERVIQIQVSSVVEIHTVVF